MTIRYHILNVEQGWDGLYVFSKEEDTQVIFRYELHDG